MGRRQHNVVGRAGVGDGNVGANGAMKQIGILQHQTGVGAQHRRIDLTYGDVVNQDPPAGWLMQRLDQL